MSRPFVTILLATYNGALFLPEQLHSLSTQLRRPDKVVLRDDGSSDNSVDLVCKWGLEEGIPVVILKAQQRLGPARSFLEILRAAGSADIYMFCDQDDVWLPEKIDRAVKMVYSSSSDVPHLYATRLKIVNERLQWLRDSPLPTELSFASAACESVLTGCTMAFNASLAKRLCSDPPRFLVMHDWWAYLVASGCGRVSFDSQPSLLYRQHGSNTLGAGPRGLAKLSARITTFFGPNSAKRSLQLVELLRLHGSELYPAAHRLAIMLTSGGSDPGLRMRSALLAPIRRQSMLTTLSTRVSILSNRF
jgi:glycosyltransferase involved in cell wall biosynthesis